VLGLTGVSLYSIAALVNLPPVLGQIELLANSTQELEEIIQADENPNLFEEEANLREVEIFTCSITLDASSGPQDQPSICNGNPIVNIIFNVDTGGTLETSNLPPGLSLSGNGTSTLTISGT